MAPITFAIERWDSPSYLIAMDTSNLRGIERITGGDPANKVRLLLEFAGERRSIADPWYTGDFDETYRDVLRGCEALCDVLCKTKKDGKIGK
ncbi:hypothetical protein [Anaeromassilibacillus senegalensis]|nr:hypothetical protein [Anaeromassilibacillus senegalensis]